MEGSDAEAEINGLMAQVRNAIEEANNTENHEPPPTAARTCIAHQIQQIQNAIARHGATAREEDESKREVWTLLGKDATGLRMLAAQIGLPPKQRMTEEERQKRTAERELKRATQKAAYERQ